MIVLPTGAGKSTVIAELARVARGRVLVLAHGGRAGRAELHTRQILRAGAGSGQRCRRTQRKESRGRDRVRRRTQSVARNLGNAFSGEEFSLLIVVNATASVATKIVSIQQITSLT